MIKMLFNNPARASQLIDYTNLQKGNMHPTDIDGVIEYKNKCYVFLEYKHGNAPFPLGQELAYCRMANDVAPKPALVIVAEHYVDNPNEVVDGGNAIVRQCYYNKAHKWITPNQNMTVKELVEKFIGQVTK